MTETHQLALELALKIAHCPAFVGDEPAGSCSKVIDWQVQQFRKAGYPEDSIRDALHVPEGWAGNLTTARILYLSSNPSFDINENFPTGKWPEWKTVDFVTRRFTEDHARPYGALDGPRAPDMDRTVQADGRRSSKVSTWSDLRRRTSVLLDRPFYDIRAGRDYAMTEVVHCKSQQEDGVLQAVSACTRRWLTQILELCPARMLIVSGNLAGAAFKSAVPTLTQGSVSLPDTWGNWDSPEPRGTGPWPSKNDLEGGPTAASWGLAEQSVHTVELDLPVGGRSTSYMAVWMPHPTGGKLRSLTKPGLYHPDLLARWRQWIADH